MQKESDKQQTSQPSSFINEFQYETQENQLITLSPEASVLDAVRLMRDHHIGDVIIAEKRNNEVIPVGIVTDRDLSVEILAQCADPEFLHVSSVMSRNLVTCTDGTSVFEMIRLMNEKGVTRILLVSDTGALKGLTNAKKLMQFLVEGMHQLSHISDKQKSNEQKMQH
jgi:CBS domain-containing protein